MKTLPELRREAGLSQADLAALAGLRQATISAIENRRSRPHRGTISALARALKTTEEVISQALTDYQEAAEEGRGGGDVDALRGDWPFLSGLDPDLRRGLAHSLVAEWTHTSTALEGNTISAGDTMFVLTEGLTVSGKSLREHQELYGHAQALRLMASWAGKGLPLRIEQLHELHRAVQTGAVIDIVAPVGRWKVEPNGTNVLSTDGATHWHEYAEPRHVPSLTKVWLDDLARACRRRVIASKTGVPDDADREALCDTYTDVHLGFVGIHPYADGNGRLARLLANLTLLRAGVPPLLLGVEQRREYLTLLGDYSIRRGQPAPGEDLVIAGPERDALHRFFAICWERTFELVIEFHDRQAIRSSN